MRNYMTTPDGTVLIDTISIIQELSGDDFENISDNDFIALSEIATNGDTVIFAKGSSVGVGLIKLGEVKADTKVLKHSEYDKFLSILSKYDINLTKDELLEAVLKAIPLK